MTTYKEKAEAYVREKLPELKGFDVDGFGVLDETPQLQDWLRVLGQHDTHAFACSAGGTLYRVNTEWELGVEVMQFCIATGQPATEADYQAYCEIVGVE